MGRAAVLLVALMALGAVTLAAQEPDTLPADTLATGTLPPADTATAADTVPEPAFTYVPPRAAFAITINRPSAGRLQSQPVLARLLSEGGEVRDTALLERAVEVDGALELGVSSVWTLGPGWALRLGAGIGRLTIRPRYLVEDTAFARATGALAADEASDATTIFLEGALRMRIASDRRAQPYLELGAAALRWESADQLAGDPGLHDGVTRIAPMAAVGAVIPVKGRLSAALQLSTRALRTPAPSAATGTSGSSNESIAITFADPARTRFADSTHELVSMLRLDVGVSMGIGGGLSTSSASATPAPTDG